MALSSKLKVSSQSQSDIKSLKMKTKSLLCLPVYKPIWSFRALKLWNVCSLILWYRNALQAIPAEINVGIAWYQNRVFFKNFIKFYFLKILCIFKVMNLTRINKIVWTLTSYINESVQSLRLSLSILSVLSIKKIFYLISANPGGNPKRRTVTERVFQNEIQKSIKRTDCKRNFILERINFQLTLLINFIMLRCEISA